MESLGNKGPQIRATCIGMIILCTLAVALRFLSRRLSRKSGFWWDDWAALAALPFVIAISGLSLYWVRIGLGQHENQVSTPITQLLVPLFAFNYLFNSALTFIKVSVLFFYARVFKIVRWYSILLWITAGLVIAWWIATCLLATFTCNPVAKAWDPMLPGGCVDTDATFLGAAIPNTIVDFILLLLPLPILWKLQIVWNVIIISIIRLVSLVNANNSLAEDFTWNILPTHIYTILEPSIALISICLPGIFHLIRQVLRLLSTGRNDPWAPLSGPGRSRIGHTANPIDGPRKHGEGFVTLNDYPDPKASSDERLFGYSHAVQYQAYAFPDRRDGMETSDLADLELGGSEHHIHVRNTVDIC